MGATVIVYVMPKQNIDCLKLNKTEHQWFLDYCRDYCNRDIAKHHLPAYGFYEDALAGWLDNHHSGRQELSGGTPICILHTSEINKHIDLLRSTLHESIDEANVNRYSEERYDRTWYQFNLLACMLQLRDILADYPDYYIIIGAQEFLN